MPQTKSGAGPGQVRGKIFRGQGQIPLFSIFFRPGLGQVVSGPGQVQSKLLVVRGRSGASFLAGTRHGFV